MKPLLEVKNLSVTFDTSIQRINALDHVSLHMNKGEIIGIIGASGSGKSTLAKTILGLQTKNQSSDGLVMYNNRDVSLDLLSQSSVQLQQFRKSEATMVFQNPMLNLNPSTTIKTHFERVLSLHGDGSHKKIISDALEQVDLGSDLDQILSAYPHQLSGGQQQRTLIALAISQQISLLLLDEPMSSLDKMNQDGISRILRRLVKEKGISIILISHDLEVIGHLSDRIYVLNEGKIVEEGNQDDILSHPKHEYTQELVEARKTGERVPGNLSGSVLISIDSLAHVYRKGGFLKFNKVKTHALEAINIIINKGSITGLVGPSGSGKSTLVKILLGNEELQTGSIKWNVDDQNDVPLWKRIQLVPQNTADALNPRMLLDNQLKEVYRTCYANSDHYDKVITALLSDVDLDGQLRYRYPSELSGGEIQRMAIVRAVIVRPDVLVLDESLSALDMLVQKKLVDMIVDLNKKLQMTIIMISHDDRLVGSCCDSIIYLHQGKTTSM